MNSPRRDGDPAASFDEHRFIPDMSEGAEAGLYLALLELFDEGLIIASDELILEVNSAACRLLEREYRQLAGRPLSQIFPSERAFLEARERLFIQGEMRGSLQLSLPDGSARTMRFIAAARLRPGIHALIISPEPSAAAHKPSAVVPAGNDQVWARLAAALDQPVWVLDAKQHVVAANTAALQLLGLEREQLIGRALGDCVQLYWPEHQGYGWASIDFGQGAQPVRMLPGPHQGWRLLVLPTKPNHSTTEPAQAALESDSRFRQVFAHSPLPSLLCDPASGLISDANAAASRTYGYPPAELVGLALDQLRSSEQAGQQIESGVWSLRRADGASFEAEVLVFPLGTNDGESLALLHDLPDRPLLSGRTRVPTAAFDSFSQALLITDEQQRILAVNPAFTALTGYSREEVIGRTPALLNAGHHDAAFFAAMWAQIETTGQWQGQIWNRLKNGETQPQWLAIKMVRDHDGQPLHYIGMLSELSRARAAAPAQPAQAQPSPSAVDQSAQLEAQFLSSAELAHRLDDTLQLVRIELAALATIAREEGQDCAAQLLALAQQRVQGALPGSPVLCIAPTELVLLLTGSDEALAALPALLDQAYALGQREWRLSSRIGWASLGEHGSTLQVLLDHAGAALDSAQPGQARRYDPSGDREPLERRLLAASLGRAASRNELVLRLRPLTRAGQRQPLGAEALLYWQHPELGLIPPARLWPVARELEIEHALRDWLLAAACHAAASWPGGELPVLVVLSPAQCTHERLPERIAELLQQSGLASARLELGIPGEVLLAPTPALASNLQTLAELGLPLVIEDFGIAPIPPLQLKRLPFAAARLGDGQAEAGDAVVAAMSGLAQAFGLELAACEVPDPTRASVLAALGCTRHYLCESVLESGDFVALLQSRSASD